MSIRITKIREKKEAITVHYVTDGVSGSFTASQAPAKAFVNALDGLKPIVQSICGFEDEWMETVRILGMTLTPFGEDNFKVTLVAKKDLAAGSPLNIPVPYRFLNATEAEEEGEGGPNLGAITLTEAHAARVNKLCTEAIKYIKSLAPIGQMYMSFAGAGAVKEGETADETPSNVAKFPAQTEGKAKRVRRSKKNDQPELPGTEATGTEAAAR